tara:strand:+ start:1586 stop:2608 length:1023 start_codon:yes stop_codon:yes gene_type:complete
MIKFFRKIRLNFLSEGKTGKYFKYAIGEIVLVVIGILIALSINNWNEDRKSANNTKLLFQKTLEELKFNIDKANAAVAYFRYQDSVYYDIFNKKVTKDIYKDIANGYANLLISGRVVQLSDDTFQKLLNSEQKLTQKQDSLLSKLKLVYGKDKAEVDIFDAKLPDYVFDLHKTYKDEKSWYPDFISLRSIRDDMTDYFLTDPEYISNAAYFYSMFPGQQNSSLKKFRSQAIIRYSELSNYLNIIPDTTILKDLINYKHFLGTYKKGNLTLNIKEEANSLIQTVITDDNSTTILTGKLYLDSKSYFTDRLNFGRLIYDNDNRVTGIEYTRGGLKFILEKIN